MMKAALLLLLPLIAQADVYMHNPRGANDRGCKTTGTSNFIDKLENDNRENDNRLFDSQNNDKGGYACPKARPFACYKLPTVAERAACNSLNADLPYDDISGLNMMDDDGVLHPQGTRTPKMYYHEGSILQLEWTAQHGCGENPRTHCDIVLQYACEDTLTDDCGEPDSGKQCGPRDGLPMTNSDQQRQVSGSNDVSFTNVFANDGAININRRDRDYEATERIPTSIDYNVQSDPRFGRHEPLSYYVKCRQRERNKGLWIADRKLNADDATRTRQNNNGNRNGLECPEERDYYPYWGPSPWKDIAILTDRFDQCNSIVAESQNVKPKFECSCPSCVSAGTLVPNNRGGCSAVGGTWVMIPAHNIPQPICGPAPASRENNLGNPIGGGKSASTFNWTIPYNVPAGKTCVLRLRYNISTGDPIPNTNLDVTISGTSALNAGNSPIKDRQNSEIASYKSFIELPTEFNPSARLGLSINTNQFGRTFQDRSWSFEIRKAPDSGPCAGKVIYNLNVRGKRGGIQDVYPNVEYDFVPNELYVTDADCVHVQWTGSDFNPNRQGEDGYGGPPDPKNMAAARTDRHNMVGMTPLRNKFITSLDGNGMFAVDRTVKKRLAFLDQPIDDPNLCMSIEALYNLSILAPGNPLYIENGNNFLDDVSDRERYFKNCGKLSGQDTPYFDAGPLPPGMPGDYYYMSTRGNSFGIRAQIGILRVQSAVLANGSIIYVVMGSAVGMAMAFAGVIAFRRRSGREYYGAANENGVFLPFVPSKTATEQAPPVPNRAQPGAAAVPVYVAKSKSAETTVKAVYTHKASETGELSFKKGDVIVVLRKDESGWWEGRTPDGKIGIFPSNYVS